MNPTEVTETDLSEQKVRTRQFFVTISQSKQNINKHLIYPYREFQSTPIALAYSVLCIVTVRAEKVSLQRNH